MSALTIESLGLSKDDIADRVVDRLVDTMLHSYVQHPDGGDDVEDTKFKADIQERVRQRIDRAIDEIAARNVLPNIGQYLENFCLQKTNEWGEKKSPPISFVEYLVQRAEAYMAEPVDHNGKTKAQDPYSWRQHSTRVAFMIERHLQYHIDSAMKTALSDANKQIAGGLEGAVKVSLSQILQNLKVSTSVGR